jgi:uncharacterized protein YbjT (DUF2867 family)
MNSTSLKVLVIGATGSVGLLVVEEALRAGHAVRALVRNQAKVSRLPASVETVIGDVTQPDTLAAAVDGVDAIVLTVNADGQGKAASEAVYYCGIRDLITAISGRDVRIALMTTIGVTERLGSYNRSNEGHDWKRRGERLLRASGLPYTIVRPGWFDYNAADEHRLVFLQGDRRHAGDLSDGAIARAQIAEVLVASLTSSAAMRTTFELVAGKGEAQKSLTPFFAALMPDPKGFDAVSDVDNMPLDHEPQRVRNDLAAISTSQRAHETA